MTGSPIANIIPRCSRVMWVGPERVEAVESEIGLLLKRVGRVPFPIRSREDIDLVADKLSVVVPVFRTSAVTRDGYDLIYSMLRSLPVREKRTDLPFLLYIDRIYNVEGVGSVISGTVRQGRLVPGSELLVGPTSKGQFIPVRPEA